MPDLISWEREGQQPELMYGGTIDTVEIPGSALYRFHVAIPNVGQGPLEVRYINVDPPDGTQDVYQRIYDGSVSDLQESNGEVIGSLKRFVFKGFPMA